MSCCIQSMETGDCHADRNNQKSTCRPFPVLSSSFLKGEERLKRKLFFSFLSQSRQRK